MPHYRWEGFAVNHSPTGGKKIDKKRLNPGSD
jgi:hypothetical protein